MFIFREEFLPFSQSVLLLKALESLIRLHSSADNQNCTLANEYNYNSIQARSILNVATVGWVNLVLHLPLYCMLYFYSYFSQSYCSQWDLLCVSSVSCWSLSQLSGMRIARCSHCNANLLRSLYPSFIFLPIGKSTLNYPPYHQIALLTVVAKCLLGR